MRGYKPGRFSFNVRGGRCETCKGDGQIKIEMHFLPDVYVPCETCKGARYNRETLEVRFKGKSIADVLEMSVEEALQFFAKIPKLRRRLQTLHDVGLDYIKLGQPATTLSGGEAQRVKLAVGALEGRDRARRSTSSTSRRPGSTSPTSRSCSRCCSGSSTAGNTVLVIEHNLDVIKQADWIVDLGPEGGEAGGEIIATGTPEQIAGRGRVVHRPVPPARAAEGCGRGCLTWSRGPSRGRTRRRGSCAAARAAEPAPGLRGLRDDSDEAAEVRQDAAGAIVWLAGIAAILAHGDAPLLRRRRDRRLVVRRLGVSRRRPLRLRALLRRRQVAPSRPRALRRPRQLPSRASPARLCGCADRARALRLLARPDARSTGERPLPHRRCGRAWRRGRAVA